jgi:hypothetical protein
MDYFNKYLKYKQKYFKLKGGVFRLTKKVENCDPSAGHNCGALALHTFDLFNPDNIMEISNRCESGKFCSGIKGIDVSLLIELIKRSKNNIENSAYYITRFILYKDFISYWNNYAKGLLDPYGRSGMIIFISKNKETQYGHYTSLINVRNKPCIIDVHRDVNTGGVPIEMERYLTDYLFKGIDIILDNVEITIVENQNDKNFKYEIPGVLSSHLFSFKEPTEEINELDARSPRFFLNIKSEAEIERQKKLLEKAKREEAERLEPRLEAILQKKAALQKASQEEAQQKAELLHEEAARRKEAAHLEEVQREKSHRAFLRRQEARYEKLRRLEVELGNINNNLKELLNQSNYDKTIVSNLIKRKSEIKSEIKTISTKYFS